MHRSTTPWQLESSHTRSVALNLLPQAFVRPYGRRWTHECSSKTG